MAFWSGPLSRATVQKHLTTGVIRYSEIALTLPSGRVCRYQLQDFPIPLNASPLQIENICRDILNDKYRYCQWDRDHPSVDSDEDIFEALLLWLKMEVANVQDALAAKNNQAISSSESSESSPGFRQFASWDVIDSEGQVIANYHFAKREDAQKHASLLEQQTGKSARIQLVKKPG